MLKKLSTQWYFHSPALIQDRMGEDQASRAVTLFISLNLPGATHDPKDTVWLSLLKSVDIACHSYSMVCNDPSDLQSIRKNQCANCRFSQGLRLSFANVYFWSTKEGPRSLHYVSWSMRLPVVKTNYYLSWQRMAFKSLPFHQKWENVAIIIIWSCQHIPTRCIYATKSFIAFNNTDDLDLYMEWFNRQTPLSFC